MSSAKKASAGGEDEDDLLLRYRGEWAVEAPEPVVIENDKGLVIKTAAAHHAISAKFPKTIDPKGKQLVVQYEVKLHNGLECGGAYLKLLSENTKFDPKSFDDKAPYTISKMRMSFYSALTKHHSKQCLGLTSVLQTTRSISSSVISIPRLALLKRNT